MTQYDDQVEYQRNILAAEKWAKIPRSVHIHNLSSMWYETEESKRFLEENAKVTDVQYNNGIIERKINNKTVYVFGKPVTGKELVRRYLRGGE